MEYHTTKAKKHRLLVRAKDVRLLVNRRAVPGHPNVSIPAGAIATNVGAAWDRDGAGLEFEWFTQDDAAELIRRDEEDAER